MPQPPIQTLPAPHRTKQSGEKGFSLIHTNGIKKFQWRIERYSEKPYSKYEHTEKYPPKQIYCWLPLIEL